MSGKGGYQQGGYSTGPPATEDNPQIVSGWEYSSFAYQDQRYAYIGKDETTGEPEFLDYGGKAANAEAKAEKQGGKKWTS